MNRIKSFKVTQFAFPLKTGSAPCTTIITVNYKVSHSWNGIMIALWPLEVPPTLIIHYSNLEHKSLNCYRLYIAIKYYLQVLWYFVILNFILKTHPKNVNYIFIKKNHTNKSNKPTRLIQHTLVSNLLSSSRMSKSIRLKCSESLDASCTQHEKYNYVLQIDITNKMNLWYNAKTKWMAWRYDPMSLSRQLITAQQTWIIIITINNIL